jgi:hypothetical protein
LKVGDITTFTLNILFTPHLCFRAVLQDLCEEQKHSYAETQEKDLDSLTARIMQMLKTHYAHFAILASHITGYSLGWFMSGVFIKTHLKTGSKNDPQIDLVFL